MKSLKPMRKARGNGFTLIETMITLLILSIIMGAVFTQINTATKRSAAEQVKLDMFQESREFVDQMGRDIRQAGYPNQHNLTATALATDAKNAVGILLIGPGDIWFQGDVDGTAVSMIKYHLDTSTTGNCPCLRRSVVLKSLYTASGNTTDNYSVEVQGVQNPGTTNWQTANPIFRFYQLDGTEVDLSAKTNNRIDALDIYGFTDGTDTASTTAEKQVLASIARVKVELSVQAQYADLQTQLKPIITLNSMIMLNNCNSVWLGQGLPMACN